jgi:hypothetical protein
VRQTRGGKSGARRHDETRAQGFEGGMGVLKSGSELVLDETVFVIFANSCAADSVLMMGASACFYRNSAAHN